MQQAASRRHRQILREPGGDRRPLCAAKFIRSKGLLVSSHRANNMKLNLPNQFVIYDTEFTSWEGAFERGWSGPNEFRELVQIGALKVNEELAVIEELLIYLKPLRNPELSDYFKDLTGISQEEVDERGEEPKKALAHFSEWVGGIPMYAFGRDGDVIMDNCKLLEMDCPFKPEHFHDVRDVFIKHGIQADEYQSGTILKAFGKEPSRQAHDALNDARSILDALLLLKKSKP